MREREQPIAGGPDRWLCRAQRPVGFSPTPANPHCPQRSRALRRQFPDGKVPKVADPMSDLGISVVNLSGGFAMPEQPTGDRKPPNQASGVRLAQVFRECGARMQEEVWR